MVMETFPQFRTSCGIRLHHLLDSGTQLSCKPSCRSNFLTQTSIPMPHKYISHIPFHNIREPRTKFRLSKLALINGNSTKTTPYTKQGIFFRIQGSPCSRPSNYHTTQRTHKKRSLLPLLNDLCISILITHQPHKLHPFLLSQITLPPHPEKLYRTRLQRPRLTIKHIQKGMHVL